MINKMRNRKLPQYKIDRIRELRSKTNLTLRAIAKEMGITAAGVHKYVKEISVDREAQRRARREALEQRRQDPEFERARVAALRVVIQTDEYKAKMSLALINSPKNQVLVANGRTFGSKSGPTHSREHMRQLRLLQEERNMAWCPKEYWPLFKALRRKRYRSAYAKQLTLDQIEIDQRRRQTNQRRQEIDQGKRGSNGCST